MIGYLVLGALLYAIVWLRVSIEIVDVWRRGVTAGAVAAQGLLMALVPPVAIVMLVFLIAVGWRPWRLGGWARPPAMGRWAERSRRTRSA